MSWRMSSAGTYYGCSRRYGPHNIAAGFWEEVLGQGACNENQVEALEVTWHYLHLIPLVEAVISPPWFKRREIALLLMGSGIYSRICEMEGIVKVIFGKYNLPQKIRKLKLIWYEKVSQWTGLGPLSDSVLKEIISGKVTFRQKYRWFARLYQVWCSWSAVGLSCIS